MVDDVDHLRVSYSSHSALQSFCRSRADALVRLCACACLCVMIFSKAHLATCERAREQAPNSFSRGSSALREIVVVVVAGANVMVDDGDQTD